MKNDEQIVLDNLILNQCQFGRGILDMVGPKKQGFWPIINVLKDKPLYFMNTINYDL